MLVIALALILFLIQSGPSADVLVFTLPPRGDVTLPLTPGGKVELRREGGATRVRIEIERPPLPGARGTGYNTYVAWSVSPEGLVENLGELYTDDDKVRLNGVSHFEQFGLLITAEPHYLIERPGQAVVFQAQPPRNTTLRQLAVKVPLSTTDYSAHKTGALAIPLIQQARAAVEIARSAEADRFAQPELRAALVALETMEEMSMRAVPPDILLQSANEAVRRGHHAAVTARSRKADALLRETQNEVAGLNRSVQRLEARIQDLGSQLDGAGRSMRQLQSDLESARRSTAAAIAERDQTETRLRQIEQQIQRERAEREKAAADYQTELRLAMGEVAELVESPAGPVLRIPDTAFDGRRATLSPAGRQILGRLAGVMRFTHRGRVRISGHLDSMPPEAANVRLSLERAESARTALAESGISIDRVDVAGLGGAQPLVLNDTPDNRARNRRLEILLLRSAP